MSVSINNAPDDDEQAEPAPTSAVVGFWEFCSRWKGQEIGNAKPKSLIDRIIDGLLSAVGAFIGLLIVCTLNYETEPFEKNMFIASFGASAVLIYAAPEAPLSQPWNFVVGHLVAAFTGVSFRNIFDDDPDLYYVSAPLSCAVAILLQHVLLCVHPPGGATAMIANALPITDRWKGFYFLVTPVGLGVIILSSVGFVTNNIFRRRHYPHKWAAFF
eukprot:TRINITY_DN7473_c0_g1_i1.p1 TRINITY_DN7473_c0_g1~~TRINITY_DN7473_c0_g1_i1.p1  ORF type:complete len:232 (+),score=25.65 TRINITY_DN7473_c0_g1_i1:54-698(+)